MYLKTAGLMKVHDDQRDLLIIVYYFVVLLNLNQHWNRFNNVNKTCLLNYLPT